MGISGHVMTGISEDDKDIALKSLRESKELPEGLMKYDGSLGFCREDYESFHLVLLSVAKLKPRLSGLGTVIIGSEDACDFCMGVVYYHSCDAIRTMRECYEQITRQDLLACIEDNSENPDFGLCESDIDWVEDQFRRIVRELGYVADNRWALISGMW